MGDSGLACELMGVNATIPLNEGERLGPLLEIFVLQELRRQASWWPDPIEFFHYRDRDDFEVNIVLEYSRGRSRSEGGGHRRRIGLAIGRPARTGGE